MSDLKHNANEWNSLSKEDQVKITDILRNNNLLGADENVIADSSVPEETDPEIGIPCKKICDAAEAAAMVACDRLPFPANKACRIAAHAAGDLCRKKCK